MDRRQRENAAAAALRECRQAFAAGGTSAIAEVTGRDVAAVDGLHYPPGEVYDPATHAQYFYHRHAGGSGGQRGPEAREHGHFHLFLRGDGVPAGITPLLLPDAAVANAPMPSQSAPLKRGRRDEVCHLVAIALDARGEPIRLFTTNRWVTGESWYGADDVIGLLERFRLRSNAPLPLVNRWLAALLQLFATDIAVLLHERDRVIQKRRWRWRTNVLEDPRLEIASSLDISLDTRLAAIEEDSNAPAVAAGANGARRLPRMAEGWGA